MKAHYNLIRPHQALNEKKSAEIDGIDLKMGRNKWREVIQNGVKAT